MKVITLTKNHLIAIFTIVMSLTVAAVSAGFIANAQRLIPIYCVETPHKKIALLLMQLGEMRIPRFSLKF